MKSGWITAISIAILAVGTTTWAGGTGPTGPAPGVSPGLGERLQQQERQKLLPKPKAPIPLARECRDPAAQSLTFQVLSRGLHPTEGRIRITGVVKNVGNAVFESDPRQATAALYETPAGGRGTIKAQQSIARLEPNAMITLNYERDWSISTEFPPTFALLISYDPDIYLDANKKNDDCNQNNNKKELPGTEINRGWPR